MLGKFARALWPTVLVSAVFLALLPTAAEAGTIQCGDTITTDTLLDHDLINCPGNGIVIGADDLTLDLDGHTIDGTFRGNGVDNSAGHDGVTIQGGSVRQFGDGVLILGARKNRVRHLTSSRNRHAGIGLLDSTATRVDRNSAVDNLFIGIYVTDGSDVRVEHNHVARNRFLDGISVFDSDHLRVGGNVSRGNGLSGILVIGSDASTVEHNSVSDNGFAGINLDHSDRNAVENNDLFRNNAEGIIVIGDGNTIISNRVANTLGNCDGCGHGISFEGGRDNLIANNDIAGAREAGIRVAAFEPDTPPAVGNTVRSNTVRDAARDGILVASNTTSTLLERNRVEANGDDGIDVQSDQTTIASNTANQNADLGIEAVPGVTDGGGNKASGNGDPRQCTNVECN